MQQCKESNEMQTNREIQIATLLCNFMNLSVTFNKIILLEGKLDLLQLLQYLKKQAREK